MENMLGVGLSHCRNMVTLLYNWKGKDTVLLYVPLKLNQKLR